MTRSNLSLKIAGLRFLTIFILALPSQAFPKNRLELPTRDHVIATDTLAVNYFPRNPKEAQIPTMVGISSSDTWDYLEEVVFHTESDLDPPVATLTPKQEAVLTLTQKPGQGRNGTQHTETATDRESPESSGNAPTPMALTTLTTLYQEPAPTNNPTQLADGDTIAISRKILAAVPTVGEYSDYEQVAHSSTDDSLVNPDDLTNLDNLILKSTPSYSRTASSYIPRIATNERPAQQAIFFGSDVRRNILRSITAWSLTTLTELQYSTDIAPRSSRITSGSVKRDNEAGNVHPTCYLSIRERDEYHWPWSTMFYRRQHVQPTSTATLPKWIDSHKPQTMCGRGLGDAVFDPLSSSKLCWIPGDVGGISKRQIVQPIEEIPAPPPLLDAPPVQEGPPPLQRPTGSYPISTATSIVCSESTWALVLMFMALFPIGFTICGTEVLVRFIWFRAFPADVKDKVLVQNWRVYKRMIGVGMISIICVLVGILAACFLRNGVCEDLKLLQEVKWGSMNSV
ncbi:hypothetical protein AA313_de0209404 [Arthrobotrys entomopaga]|nr:hypothetical protein AA313_de0209404 [Arthrobotrys entomopaga]